MAQKKSNLLFVIGVTVSICVAMALIVAVGGGFLAYRIYQDRFAPVWKRYVTYSDMSFSGSMRRRSYESFSTGVGSDSGRGIAPIYIRLPSGTVVHIPNLTAADAKELFGKDGFDVKVNGVNEFHFFVDLGNGCVFEKGRLVTLRLWSQSTNSSAAIGPTPNGPFKTLPISFDELEPTFGAPVEKFQMDLRTRMRKPG